MLAIPGWLSKTTLLILSALYSILSFVLLWWQTFDRLEQIEPQLMVKITLGLLLLLFLSSVWLLWLFAQLTQKPNPRHFQFINPPGLYKHKKNEHYYCQPCLDGIEKLSPLYWENPAGLLCRLCGSNYKVSIPAGTLFSGLEQELDRASAEIKANPEYQKLLKEARGEI